MINDINLLPDRILYKNKIILLNIAKVSLTLILVAVIVYGVLFIRLERNKMEKQVADITATIDKSALKALSDSKSELLQKQNQKKELDDMLKGVPIDSIKMTELLARITNLMPATIKAESIKYAALSGGIELSLIGGNREDISLFLKLLHDDGLFLDVNIMPIASKTSPFRFIIILNMTHKENNKK